MSRIGDEQSGTPVLSEQSSCEYSSDSLLYSLLECCPRVTLVVTRAATLAAGAAVLTAAGMRAPTA